MAHSWPSMRVWRVVFTHLIHTVVAIPGARRDRNPGLADGGANSDPHGNAPYAQRRTNCHTAAQPDFGANASGATPRRAAEDPEERDNQR